MVWNITGRTAWSPAEDAQLLALLAEGKSSCAIAKAIGRRESSVYRRIEILAAKPKMKMRPCLCCGREFQSAGPHNRLCGACRNLNVSPYAP